VLWERLYAELVDERVHPVLGGTDPLGAHVERVAVDLAGERPPAHAVAGLQDGHVGTGLVEAARGGQPGEAGPDHDHVRAVGGVHGSPGRRPVGSTFRRWVRGLVGVSCMSQSVRFC
jgi:hypothetical protein